ncbi:hypothetical protein GCM10023347_48150 [Streptomyces chumphonensis]|uniref:Lipoprotein n=1 Tax=Streptomyces chumphonensis TaxID=1214925 RepID=A0A927F1I8_9ACTN|nr:hypothetical protein [Streptomyces chumphonensis]MBD3932982.1 hypothetical protein [Streptomyces chumphonensis]
MGRILLFAALLISVLVGCSQNPDDDESVELQAACHGILDGRVAAGIIETGRHDPEELVEIADDKVKYPGKFCNVQRKSDALLQFDLSYAWVDISDAPAPPEERRSDDSGYVYDAGEDIEIVSGGRLDPGVSTVRFRCEVADPGPRAVEGRLIEHLFGLNQEATFSVLLASAEKAAEGFGCRNALDFPDAADVKGPAPTASATPEG